MSMESNINAKIKALADALEQKRTTKRADYFGSGPTRRQLSKIHEELVIFVIDEPEDRFVPLRAVNDFINALQALEITINNQWKCKVVSVSDQQFKTGWLITTRTDLEGPPSGQRRALQLAIDGIWFDFSVHADDPGHRAESGVTEDDAEHIVKTLNAEGLIPDSTLEDAIVLAKAVVGWKQTGETWER